MGGPQDPQSENQQRLERAASYFVAQLDDRSDAKAAERDAWLNADPRNAVAYARVSAAWDKAAPLRCVAPAPDHDETRPVEALSSREGQDQQ